MSPSVPLLSIVLMQGRAALDSQETTESRDGDSGGCASCGHAGGTFAPVARSGARQLQYPIVSVHCDSCAPRPFPSREPRRRVEGNPNLSTQGQSLPRGHP